MLSRVIGCSLAAVLPQSVLDYLADWFNPSSRINPTWDLCALSAAVAFALVAILFSEA